MTAREQSEALLRQLHALIAAGQGDSDEADVIRDQTDEPWNAMTEAERNEIRALSEQLYIEAEKRP